MQQVSNDTCRCFGTQCIERKSCLRYAATFGNKTGIPVPYSDNMCYDEQDGFSGSYKIELRENV